MRKEETKKMHVKMDERFEGKHKQLKDLMKLDKLSGFWQAWSSCVEPGVLRYLGNDMHIDKKNLGRGSVRILTKKRLRKKAKARQRTRTKNTVTYVISILEKL